MPKEVLARELTDVSLPVGSALPCYNPGGGRVGQNQHLCRCGQRLVRLVSSTDPGQSIACISVWLAYHLPETQRLMPESRKPLTV